MDCLAWVNRDSYLPQGSRGLKVRSGTPIALDTKVCGPCIIGTFDYCWDTYITSVDAIIQRMFTLAGWGCQQAGSTPQNTPGRPSLQRLQVVTDAKLVDPEDMLR